MAFLSEKPTSELVPAIIQCTSYAYIRVCVYFLFFFYRVLSDPYIKINDINSKYLRTTSMSCIVGTFPSVGRRSLLDTEGKK